MAESKPKIVAKKKLFGFSKEALEELKRKKMAAGSGATETGVIEQLILGKESFSPVVERVIGQLQDQRGESRERVIEQLLQEGILALTERGDYGEKSAKKKKR